MSVQPSKLRAFYKFINSCVYYLRKIFQYLKCEIIVTHAQVYFEMHSYLKAPDHTDTHMSDIHMCVPLCVKLERLCVHIDPSKATAEHQGTLFD